MWTTLFKNQQGGHLQTTASNPQPFYPYCNFTSIPIIIGVFGDGNKCLSHNLEKPGFSVKERNRLTCISYVQSVSRTMKICKILLKFYTWQSLLLLLLVKLQRWGFCFFVKNQEKISKNKKKKRKYIGVRVMLGSNGSRRTSSESTYPKLFNTSLKIHWNI